MFRKSVVACFAVCVLAAASAASAQSGTYNQALNAYFSGDYETAEALMSIAIGDSSVDARQYYYRGLARLGAGLKDEAAKDFMYAANLEASGQSRGGSVDRALEKVQGSARRTLEKYRREARREAAIKAGHTKRARALDRMYTQARTAYFAERYEDAGLVFDEIISRYNSRDPRVYYFRGLCLEQLGRDEDAADDFQMAVELELAPANFRIDVDVALERVQGDVRTALESHRQAAIGTLRQQKRLERQQMIAQLVQQRQGVVASATASPSSVTPGGVATTTPSTTTPGTGTSPDTGSPTATVSTTVPTPDGPAINLAWIPDDAEVLVHFRVYDTWNSELLRPFHTEQDITDFIDEMQAATDLTLNDVDSVTASFSGVANAAEVVGFSGPQALAGSTDQLVAVVRVRTTYDPQFLDAQTDLFQKANHNGTSYYRSLDGGQTPCIYMADFKTLILADEAKLTELIDAGDEPTPRPDLAFLDTSKELVIAFVPKDAASLTAQIPDEPTGSPSADALLAAMKGNLNGFAIGFGFSDAFELQVQLLGSDEANATEMGTALKQGAQELTGIWDLFKGAAPEPVQPIVDTLLRSLRASNNGDVAMVSARLSSQAIQRVVAAVGELGPMMLGGMAGPGGPGDFGPGDFGPGDFGEPVEAPMATRPATPVQVTAKAQISQVPDFDDEANELPKAIELVIDIVGDDALKANAWGFPELTTATDNNGTDLVIRDRMAFGSSTGFTDIDRDDFFVEHPDDGCQVAIALEPPQNKAESIASAEGILKLRVVGESENFEIADAASLLGQELQNPKLAEGGYKLTLGEKEEDFGGGLKVKMWTVTWDNPDPMKIDAMVDGGGIGLQAPVLVDADGNPVGYFDGVEAVSFGPSVSFTWTMTVDSDNPPPADAKLQFSINKKVDFVDVPFKVQNVEITEDAGF